MIRPLFAQDIDAVLEIWLESSAVAHRFIPRSYWESRLDDMRCRYLPTARNAVWQDDDSGEVIGFVSMVDNYIAALFVRSGWQGRGIGSRLLAWAGMQHDTLELAVYAGNRAALGFYQDKGFEIHSRQVDAGTGQPEYVMRRCRKYSL